MSIFKNMFPFISMKDVSGFEPVELCLARPKKSRERRSDLMQAGHQLVCGYHQKIDWQKFNHSPTTRSDCRRVRGVQADLVHDTFPQETRRQGGEQ